MSQEQNLTGLNIIVDDPNNEDSTITYKVNIASDSNNSSSISVPITGTEYTAGELIYYEGHVYKCINDTTFTDELSSDDWELYVLTQINDDTLVLQSNLDEVEQDLTAIINTNTTNIASVATTVENNSNTLTSMSISSIIVGETLNNGTLEDAVGLTPSIFSTKIGELKHTKYPDTHWVVANGAELSIYDYPKLYNWIIDEDNSDEVISFTEWDTIQNDIVLLSATTTVTPSSTDYYFYGGTPSSTAPISGLLLNESVFSFTLTENTNWEDVYLGYLNLDDKYISSFKYLTSLATTSANYATTIEFYCALTEEDYNNDNYVLINTYSGLSTYVEYTLDTSSYPRAYAYKVVPTIMNSSAINMSFNYLKPAVNNTISKWDGIGGVSKFGYDEENSLIKLPDLRGMYLGSTGIDDFIIGDTDIDRSRNIYGCFGSRATSTGLYTIYMGSSVSDDTGVFTSSPNYIDKYITTTNNTTTQYHNIVSFNSNRVNPSGNNNKPRTIYIPICVYIG